ncbi:hypothetical protein HK405_010038 [Cladochytrium tenue]|nr:hypothetical protein HK405_010038 [Cladochytrium tenue]
MDRPPPLVDPTRYDTAEATGAIHYSPGGRAYAPRSASVSPRSAAGSSGAAMPYYGARPAPPRNTVPSEPALARDFGALRSDEHDAANTTGRSVGSGGGGGGGSGGTLRSATNVFRGSLGRRRGGEQPLLDADDNDYDGWGKKKNGMFAVGGAGEDLDDEDGRPRRRGLMACLCCCIPRRPLYRIVCAVGVVIVLVLAVVLGYMFWPRFPSFKVAAINFAPNNTFAVIRNATYPNNFNYATFQANMILTVNVTNNNRYNLGVNSISLLSNLEVNTTALTKEGVHPATLSLSQYIGAVLGTVPTGYNASTTPQIGTGNASAVVFQAGTTQQVNMSFVFAYTPDPVVGMIDDPAFAEFVNVCGVLGTARPAVITYAAKSDVSVLTALGLAPTVTGQVSINCPVSSSQISAFEGEVLAGVSISQAFSDVFSGGISGSVNATQMG